MCPRTIEYQRLSVEEVFQAIDSELVELVPFKTDMAQTAECLCDKLSNTDDHLIVNSHNLGHLTGL